MGDLRVAPELAARLRALTQGRPIVIDHFASHRCGPTIGDLRVRIGADLETTPAVEAITPDGIRIVVERDIVAVLATGAELRRVGPPFARRLAIVLDNPETWLDFLHTHPHNRR
jgi:hypothetical protein